MNINTVIGLNGAGENDDGVYISPEDIDFAQTTMDRFGNKHTTIYTKAGNQVVVLGNAYYILGMDKKPKPETLP